MHIGFAITTQENKAENETNNAPDPLLTLRTRFRTILRTKAKGEKDMFDFKPTEDIISMSEFRNTLADCVARTAETHRPIILTQNGRATAVFLSAEEWEKITEKLYNAEVYEDILVSEGESERGEVYTTEEVMRMTDEAIKSATRPPRAKKRTQKLSVA
jgi:prevent-host-death family protein